MYKNTTPVIIAVFTFALTLAISGCESEKPGEAPTPQQAEVLVPKVTGLPLDQAQSEIESAGLKVGTIEKQPTEEVAPNAVWKQEPAENTLVTEGAAVNFIVAVMPKVGVPDLIGRPVATAKTSIINAGLTVGAVTERATNDVPAGFVIGQMPIPPEEIAKGEAVALSVSVAPPKPQLSGMGPMESNTDRMGSDFSNFDLATANPQLCQDQCAGNPNCQAWTYVKPNTIQGPRPRCWLKNAIPRAKEDTCCVSGTRGDSGIVRFQVFQVPLAVQKQFLLRGVKPQPEKEP